MYLNVPEKDPNSKQSYEPDRLVDAWLEAYKVAAEAKNYILAEDLPALVNDICQKFEGIKAYAAAAELCKDYGLPPRPNEPRIVRHDFANKFNLSLCTHFEQKAHQITFHSCYIVHKNVTTGLPLQSNRILSSRRSRAPRHSSGQHARRTVHILLF